MAFIILIAFLSLISLVVLHELGHFVLAKRFGVKVEEFGIGLPPRIIGKKIGETIYSLNLLPFGAFVKIYGEEGGIEDYRSFSSRPIWQRSLIVLGGVVVFWIIGFILLSIIMLLGASTLIEDTDNHNLVDPRVQITQLAAGSPAEMAGLKIGDTIKQLKVGDDQIQTTKVKEVQDFTASHLSEEVTITIQRGKEIFDTKLVLRASPPENEGPMGIGLDRVATISYPWYQAPIQGAIATWNLTIAIIQGLYLILKGLIVGTGLPAGTQIMGPVGIFSVFTQMAQLGASYFIGFIAVISIYLAVFNILPIPALDGGKLIFLAIEAIRKKPVPEKIEQRITVFFFALLMVIMLWATIKDVIRLF